MRRMDKYNNEDDKNKITRSSKNKELYDSIGSNTRYTNFSDVTESNAIDISSEKNANTREGYHQLKEYKDVVTVPRVKKELEEFKSLYQNRENKVYDINSILEEARKSRYEKDELEEKRNLKNQSYNILSNINKKELEKYRKERKAKKVDSSNEEIRELIDTITSKTLAGDINAASLLLSDLMATSIMDQVDKPEELENNDEDDQDADDKLNIDDIKKLSITKLQLDTKEKSDSDTDTTPNITSSFYTRSMDLSQEDFELDDEFKEKHLPVGVKILIVLIIMVIIASVAFFLWKNK